MNCFQIRPHPIPTISRIDLIGGVAPKLSMSPRRVLLRCPGTLLALLAVLSSRLECWGKNSEDTRVFAIYFPQFHEDPTNNRLWGRGFTDWDRVRQHAGRVNRYGNRIPQPGELGYYNLSATEVRRRQARLAREFGVDGFLYYHYWFGGPGQGPVLADPLERMLRDGEPDLPFAFIWANEHWSASWHGAAKPGGTTLIEQLYPEDSELILDHYRHLRQFFHHKNYIKVDGAPLFMPYRLNRHQYDREILSEAVAYIRALSALATGDGFPGLHIPFPALFGEHELYTSHPSALPPMPSPIDDAVVFWAYPTLLPNRQIEIPPRCKKRYSIFNDEVPHYLGLTTVFDHSLRRTWGKAFVWQREFSRYNATASFELDLMRALMFERCCQNPKVRQRGGKFLMINAWNEWGEGMALEPSDAYGYEFLRAIKRAKKVVSEMQCEWSELRFFEESFADSQEINHKSIAKFLRRSVEELQKVTKGAKRITPELSSRFKDLVIFSEKVVLPLIEKE